MLSARKLDVPIEDLDSLQSTRCTVVFNMFKGNIEEFNPYTWDEPPEYDDVEIVAVNPIDMPNSNVYYLLTDREEEYLKDLIVATLEDE